MALTKPYFKLYASNGTDLVYTFPIVQSTNLPQTVKKTIEIKGQRGKGSIIVDGGNDTWDLEIRGLFVIDNADEGYEEITVKIDTIESAIELNTPYVLRVDKTDSTYYEYNVKRINPITYPSSLRTDLQEYIVTFIVNSW